MARKRVARVRVEKILGPAYAKGFEAPTGCLSEVAVEANKDLNSLQDELERRLKRATEMTLNLKMTV